MERQRESSRLPWTEEELEALRDMARSGLTAEEMTAVLVDRTVSSVQNRLLRDGQRIVKRKARVDRELFNAMMGGVSDG